MSKWSRVQLTLIPVPLWQQLIHVLTKTIIVVTLDQVTDWQTPPTSTNCTAGAVCYTPQGSVYGMSIGQTSSFTGFNILENFNSRLQPSEIKASSSAGSAIDITYNFVDPVSGHNAGHVYGIANNLNSGRSQTFTYDQLNRIVSAGTTATTGTYCWGYQYSLNPWGNLTSQAGWSPNYNACTETTMALVTGDGLNHISAFSYDASGNALSDGLYSYTWNAESQMKTAAGVTYSYDGDGRRAAKVGSKLYWYGSGGEILAETDASGNIQNEYIFFAGKRVALLNLASIDVRFTNDSCSGCVGTPVGGGDRNLYINSITVGSTTILPNDPSVSYTGTPCNGDYSGVAILYCNGDMIANKPAGAPGQTITVNAYGTTDYSIYPHMQLYLNGILLAQWDVTGSAQNYSVTIPSTAVQYFAEDLLGSSRVIVQSNGTLCYDADFTPYGAERAYTATCAQNYKFEGKERDGETLNDNFGAREYSWRFGRWLSADWSSVPVPVPYANLTNPQTLNLYAMVADDPESFADLDGHGCDKDVTCTQPNQHIAGNTNAVVLPTQHAAAVAGAGATNAAMVTQNNGLWGHLKSAFSQTTTKVTIGIGLGGKVKAGPGEVKLEAAVKGNVAFSAGKLSFSKSVDFAATAGKYHKEFGLGASAEQVLGSVNTDTGARGGVEPPTGETTVLGTTKTYGVDASREGGEIGGEEGEGALGGGSISITREGLGTLGEAWNDLRDMVTVPSAPAVPTPGPPPS